MRLTLITIGTPGDVRPFIALGVALTGAGHAVRIATHEPFRDLAVANGLDFHPLPGDPDEILASDSGQRLLGAGASPIRNLRSYFRLADELLDGFVAGSVAASADAELIIGSASGLLAGGLHAGEKLGTPTGGAFLQPLHGTSDFASFLFPPWPFERDLGRATYNRASHAAVQQIGWQLVRRRLDRSRREQLCLAAMSRRGPGQVLSRKDRLWLYGYSPALLPRPSDWPSNVHVTGYWFLDDETGWQPSRELADFLASGPAPVYVGFGSAGRFRSDETTPLVIEALRSIGQRGILGVPGQESEVRVLSDDAIAVGRVPHAWLFPRTSVVVHHVGLGTLETALRANRPAVAVPHTLDEPFWAARLAHLGVSPRPIPRLKLTASRLAGRIRLALTDETMAERASRLGGIIGTENGAQRAVAAIEAHVGIA